MSNSLRDKVLVVTGASSGIGRSIALESASRGATVILMARHQDKLEEIANEARLHSEELTNFEHLVQTHAKNEGIFACIG